MSSTTLAVNNRKSKIVRAGAGAGKTTALISEVLNRAYEFKKANGRWPKFVVSTFTIKATHELRERFLVQALKDDKNTGLLEFTQSKTNLEIGTLHSIFARQLRDTGHLFGIDPNFNVLDNESSEELKYSVAIRVIKKSSSYYELWNTFGIKSLIQLSHKLHEQSLLIGHLEPMESLDISRLIYEVQEGLWSNFKEAYLQLKTYITSEASKKLSDNRLEFIDFFDSYFSKPFSASNDIENSPSIKTGAKDSEDLKVWSKVFSENRKELKAALEAPNNSKEQWEESAKLYKTFHEFYLDYISEYTANKKNDNLLEFADLEELLLSAIQAEPEVFKKISINYDGWFIDEYQDTNGVQDVILKNLVGSSPIYLVGDPQQSIYGFRGADNTLFNKKLQKFKQGLGEVEQLEFNYRADASLTHFFNDYFASFKYQEFYKQKPNPDSSPIKKTIAKFYYQPTEDGDEFSPLLQRVNELLDEGVKLSDIKILGRARATLVEAAKRLKSYGVPCSLLSGENYFNKQEVKDLRAFVIFLLNPWDNQNLIQLVRSPWFFISDETIIHCRKDKSKNLWEVLNRELLEHKNIHRLNGYLKHSKNFGVSESLQLFLNESGFLYFASEFDAVGQYETSAFRFIAEVTERLKNGNLDLLKWLRSKSSQWQSDDMGSQEVVPSINEDSIGLMTIHASKGLTFAHVILLGCHKPARQNSLKKIGIINKNSKYSIYLPKDTEDNDRTYIFEKLYRQSLRASELDESDRLHYVALTRAQHSVCLVWTGKPEKDSFLERINWDLSDGVKESNYYTYEVCPIIEHKLQNKTFRKLALRPTYTSNLNNHVLNPLLIFNQERVEVNKEQLNENSIDSFTLQKMLYGSKVHSWLELLDIQSSYTNSPLKKNDEDWLFSLANPPLKTIIEHGHREWRFSFKDVLTGELQTRQIDLWAKIDKTIYIVDYKTGKSSLIELVKPQLEEYKTILSKAHAHCKVKAYAIFVSEQKVIEC